MKKRLLILLTRLIAVSFLVAPAAAKTVRIKCEGTEVC